MAVEPTGSIFAGKYRIDGVLGEGGMEVVVSAAHIALARQGAIKLLRSEIAGHHVELAAALAPFGGASGQEQYQHCVRLSGTAGAPSHQVATAKTLVAKAPTTTRQAMGQMGPQGRTTWRKGWGVGIAAAAIAAAILAMVGMGAGPAAPPEWRATVGLETAAQRESAAVRAPPLKCRSEAGVLHTRAGHRPCSVSRPLERSGIFLSVNFSGRHPSARRRRWIHDTSGGAVVVNVPVLILHAVDDEAFVRGYLAPALGLPADSPQLRGPGELARLPLSELERELERARAVLGVLSPAFLADPWLQQAEALASTAAIAGRATLVALIRRECALPLHLQARVSLDFRDPARWDEELRQLTTFLGRPPAPLAELPCPYPGPRPFSAAEAAFFHGRQGEIAEVLARLDGGERELGVCGPSGTGKSSLINAGVLPALIRRAEVGPEGTRKVLVRTVRFSDGGATPKHQLAEALAGVEVDGAAATPRAIEATAAALLDGDAGRRLVLVLDQLEELLRRSPAEQRGLAEALRELHANPRCTLLLCARSAAGVELHRHGLWPADDRRAITIAPLRGPALQAAVAQPALALGACFEPELLVRLLDDAAAEPGALPFLQAVLVELWARRRQRLLTLASYQELGEGDHGGLAAAIARRAEQCLGELSPERARLARRTLLRLVSFGEGGPDTSRRLRHAALGAGAVTEAVTEAASDAATGQAHGEGHGEAAELDAVLHALAGARLIVLDAEPRTGVPSVELCHDALITAWPAFASWAAARRADERRRRQLQACAEEWIARGRTASGLLDAAELAAVRTWRRTAGDELGGESPEVAALLAASSAALTAERRRQRSIRWGSFAVLAAFSLLATARCQSEDFFLLPPPDKPPQVAPHELLPLPDAPRQKLLLKPRGRLISPDDIDAYIGSWKADRDDNATVVKEGWCPPIAGAPSGDVPPDFEELRSAPLGHLLTSLACRSNADDRAPWERILDRVLPPRSQPLE